MRPYHLEIKYPRSVVRKRIEEMGWEIANDFAEDDLTAVTILLGAMKFSAELVTEISRYREPRRSVEVDAFGVDSYSDTKSGKPRITQEFKNAKKNIAGKNVLIVEDIAHTRRTLANAVLPVVWSHEPKSVAVAALLMVDGAQEVAELGVKMYEGLHLDKEDFVVGEYLDMDGKHRGMEGVWKVIFENS